MFHFCFQVYCFIHTHQRSAFYFLVRCFVHTHQCSAFYFQVPCFVHTHQCSTSVFKFIVLYTPISVPLFIFKFLVSYTPINVPLLFSSLLFYTHPSVFRFLFSSLLFCTQPSLFRFYFQVSCPLNAHCILVEPIYKLPFFFRGYVSTYPAFVDSHSTPVLFACTVPRYICRFTSSSAVHFPFPSPTPLPIPGDSSSQIHRLISLYLIFYVRPIYTVPYHASSLKPHSISPISSRKTFFRFCAIVSEGYL